MEVLGSQNELIAYVSFWPEPESLIGQVTQILKARPQRRPATYEQEIDTEVGYMQRPSDFTDEVDGLDEETIVELWNTVQDTSYDLRHWNCSNICKLLIISSLDITEAEDLKLVTGCTPDDLDALHGTVDSLERLRYLATSQFIDCRPEDVRRTVEAYLILKKSLRDTCAEQASSTPSSTLPDPAQSQE